MCLSGAQMTCSHNSPMKTSTSARITRWLWLNTGTQTTPLLPFSHRPAYSTFIWAVKHVWRPRSAPQRRKRTHNTREGDMLTVLPEASTIESKHRISPAPEQDSCLSEKKKKKKVSRENGGWRWLTSMANVTSTRRPDEQRFLVES